MASVKLKANWHVRIAKTARDVKMARHGTEPRTCCKRVGIVRFLPFIHIQMHAVSSKYRSPSLHFTVSLTGEKAGEMKRVCIFSNSTFCHSPLSRPKFKA